MIVNKDFGLRNNCGEAHKDIMRPHRKRGQLFGLLFTLIANNVFFRSGKAMVALIASGELQHLWKGGAVPEDLEL